MRRLICYKSRGQVWVETVIYTLIGLTVIGILLAVSKPKIDQMKDKLVIEQSIDSLSKINDKIYEVQTAPGNRRVVELKISKGRLVLDLESDKISWIIESKYQYSEPGVNVPLGNMNVVTTEASPWIVELSIDYNINLKYNGQETGMKELNAAPTPYSIQIENSGRDNGNIIIDLSD